MKKLIPIFIASALVMLACSSSDDSSNSSGGASSGGASSSGSSGATSSSGGSSSGGSSSGGSSSFKNCAPSNSSGASCPQSEIDAYTKCALDNCGATYKECYGDNFMSGSFGGPCASYISCSQACDCNDTACYQKCTPDSACTSCNQKLGECISAKCKLPCQPETKTCAELETCCSKITDAAKKSQCEAQLGALKASGDVACNAVYTQYAADCQ